MREGDGPWQECAASSTAAAALRARGRWKLGEPAPDFDAAAWSFRTVFDADADLLDGATLGLDGVATLWEAWLNGEQILQGDNMFVAQEREVATLLRPTGNELVIRCAPLSEALRQRRPRPRWRVPMLAQQQLRWFRTTLLGRTPGWSPPVPVVGAWKDAWIEPKRAEEPTQARLQARVEGTRGVLECHVAVSGASENTRVEIRLSRGGRSWSQRLVPLGSPGGLHARLTVDDVERWWPHTHGEPCLYRAELLVTPDAGSPLIHALPPVGFRTIEVETSSGGFGVIVNGERVFCRGAVWMPLDAVTLRASADRYRDALAQVRAAGMNMLRLPGTTAYEDDDFYAACDEAGVLVWQDFMFASMDYPADHPEFLASVQTEVSQQLERLHAHPCLAVLCGNSEVEQQAAMWGAPRELWQPAFFHQTLPGWCETHAPGVAYWPSSAHGGALPQQADQGTTSYYGVGAYLRPLDDATRSGLRFATECLAFANIPGERTLQRLGGVRPHHPTWKARSPRDLGAGWDFDDVRDHYLGRLFELDPQRLRATDPDRYVALGRLATGEAMAAAFAQWRASGHCDGALVLMLRDLWAGAGWGLLDDQGHPKPCWHALRRSLQPLTVLVTDEGMNGLMLHVLNETAAARRLQLVLEALRDGDVRVAHTQVPVELAARSRKSLAAASLLDHFLDLGWAWRFGPPPCDVVACTLQDEHGVTIARCHHFSHGFGLAPERDVGLQAQIVREEEGLREVLVTARRFAMGVHFDGTGMVADDEYFHLAPGAQARVVLRGAGGSAGFIHAVNSAAGAPVAAMGAGA